MEHWCDEHWVIGSVGGCANHVRPGRAPNLTPYNLRSHITVEGVATTGEISSKGTVAHREHFDGRVDAKAVVPSVAAKLSDLKENR